MDTSLLNTFFKRGSDFLGVRYPIVCGAMTWVSDPTLVATVSNEGGFGCLAGGNMPVDILREQILETRKLTKQPFGVNFITIAPAFKEQLSLMRELQLPYVIFAGSFPNETQVRMAKDAGAKVLCFASTKSIAARMLRYGADALILEGMEAGGHVGHVSLAVLLQQLLFEIADVPIFVAGGIGTGKMAAHLFLMGAAGVQLGTRFAIAKESCAHQNFKERFIKAKAREAVSTPQFDSRLPVVAVRGLRNKGLDEFGKLQLSLLKQMDEGLIARHEAQEQVETYWMGALRKAVIDGDIRHGSLMAGQSVGLINKEESVREIIKNLVCQIEDEFLRVKKSLNNVDA